MLQFGLNEIEYDTISRLYKSITGDKYTLSLHTLNSVTSVASFSKGFVAVNSLLSKLSAILPISPLYERYLLFLRCFPLRLSSFISFNTVLWLIVYPFCLNTIKILR